MFTLAAFYESQDALGATVAVAAIADQVIRTSLDDLYVPSHARHIIAAAGGVASGGTGLCRLQAPSLRGMNPFVISPISGNADADAEPGTPHPVVDLRLAPLELIPGEILNAEVNSDTTAAAAQWALLALGDGKPELPSGRMFTVRATAAVTLTADVWTLVALTFDADLPAGRYAIVGARFESAGCVAGRLNLIGSTWRPGWMGVDTPADVEWFGSRMGGLGVWGWFDDQDLPATEFLSVSADTAEVVHIDLIRVGERGQGAP